jgi:NADH pyrophosphatase NudC (nudix superfamily)
MKHRVTAIISRINESKEKEYLLIRSNKDTGIHTGKYYPPSGGVEAGENEKDAIIRELMEELKLNIRPIRKLTETPGDLPELMIHFWECEIIDGNIEMDKIELNDVGWYTPKQMKQMDLYPATVSFFKEYLREDL